MSLTLGIIASSRGNIVPPLDTYGGAAAAYSTRLLSSAYGGSAVRVRRASDNTEQDIGFSGGAIDETALMNFVGYQNLFPQSNNFTDAIWTKLGSTVTANAGTDPFGGNAATRWLNDGSGGNAYVLQNSIGAVGPSYTMSFWVKSNTASDQQFILFANGVTVSPTFTATTQWQRFSFSFVGISGNGHGIGRSLSSPFFDLLIYGAQTNIGTVLQPYQVTTSAARSGDGFVTKWYTQDSNGENLLLQSQTFENASWTKSFTTVSVNSTTDPIGGSTAETLFEDNTNNNHYTYQPNNTLTAGTYTFSIYLKYLNRKYILVDINNGVNSGAGVVFDIELGSYVGNTVLGTGYTVQSYSISPQANGWYRYSVTVSTSGIAAGEVVLRNSNSLVWSNIYTGSTSVGVYIWGAQLSQSNWLQPYQVTTTTAILRRDASQSTAANQPRIVGGGVIERENGKAAIDHTSSQILGLPSSINLGTSYTVLAAFHHDVLGKELLGDGPSSNYLMYQDPTLQRSYHGPTNTSGFTPVRFGLDFGLISLYRSGTTLVNMLKNGNTLGSPFDLSLNPNYSFRYLSGENNPSFNLDGRLSEAIIYPTALVATLPDINRNIGAYYQTQWTGASSGLLDQFGGAAAAYSLRNLSSSYRGPLIRVRRSSDNAETDIGGTYNGDLDVASLLSFTGGQNLFTNSEDFTNAVWTTARGTITPNTTIAPNGTLTADSSICNTASVSGLISFSQNITSPSIRTEITASCYFKTGNKNFALLIIFDPINANGVRQYFNLTTGELATNNFFGTGVNRVGASIQNVGNGWYRCSLTVSFPPSVNIQIAIGPAISADNVLTCAVGDFGYVWGAQLNTGILQPYIPTTTSAVNGANAFVTKWYTQDNNYQNLVLQSENFQTSPWGTFNSSVIANTTTAPDGTLTADTFIENTALGSHQIFQIVTTTANQTYTYSVYAKLASGSRYLGISPVNSGANGNNGAAVFDLVNGAFLGTAIPTTGLTGNPFTASDVSIQSVGNGWWRLSVRISVVGTSYACALRLYNAFSNGTSTGSEYTGDGTSGVYLWGAQLNEGTLVPYTATTTTVSQRRDAIQATAASQPRIVNAGGVESEGNRPALFFDGTDDFLSLASTLSLLTSHTITSVSNNDNKSVAVLLGSTAPISNFNSDLERFTYNANGVFGQLAGFQYGQRTRNILRNGTTSISVYQNSTQFNLSIASNQDFTLKEIGRRSDLIGNNWLGDIQELTFYPTALTSSLPTIESNTNSYYQIYWQGNGTALLDNYSGASAAYSLRNLSSAYTGPLIRVRRSNDNVERDIYGTFGGDLDIASLVAFVGANSGFVTTWYDQSGNARNAAQGTAANQPRIVNAGVVDTENGKPTIFFDGTNDFFNISNGLNTLQNVGYANAFSVVTNNPAAAVAKVIIFFSNPSGSTRFNTFINGSIYRTDARRVDDVTAGTLTGSISINAQALLYSAIQYLTSDGFQYVNGAIDVSNTSFLTDGSTSNTPSSLATLGGVGASVTFNGEMQEVILYTTNQLPSKTAIESNINNYYKIY